MCMKLLVNGGVGYVGNVFTHEPLSRGHIVTGYDNLPQREVVSQVGVAACDERGNLSAWVLDCVAGAAASVTW
jgi:nucleoside-diphosphate-sugar epimerase